MTSALRISSGAVLLHPPTDDEVAEVVRAASAPGAVLPPGDEHFVTWLAGRDPDGLVRERVARVARNRDLTRRPQWTLDLVVTVSGVAVGLQSLSGLTGWPTQRIVGTTSWLLADHQRRGIGTAARMGVLAFAFEHLNAEAARSWALAQNRASIAVSERLGYTLRSRREIVEDGHVLDECVHEIDRVAWMGSRGDAGATVVVSGAADAVTAIG
ncbi:MAG: GNAT family protein [Corynebacteriales bacterium]|nr:GNAT family protein [Mycobacteriales bacterium]